MHAHTEEYRAFTLVATPVSCAITKDDTLIHATANLHTGKQWVDRYWTTEGQALSSGFPGLHEPNPNGC